MIPSDRLNVVVQKIIGKINRLISSADGRDTSADLSQVFETAVTLSHIHFVPNVLSQTNRRYKRGTFS